MRKYIVRKNFDENNIDPLNVPERSVFFEKNKSNYGLITETEKETLDLKSQSPKSSKKQEIKSEDEEISSTFTKKLSKNL